MLGRHFALLYRLTVTFATVLLLTLLAQAQVNVLTYHNDNARTGQNTSELLLTPSNVNSSSFGKLFSQTVDGAIYAQPLYVSKLSVAGGIHNVLFVATENDSVYALDAESGSQLWHANLLDTAHGAASGAVPMYFEQLGLENTGTSNTYCGNPPPLASGPDPSKQYDQGVYPYIGITGTPTVDLAAGTLFVIAKSVENGRAVNRLHALSLVTGNDSANYALYDAPQTNGWFYSSKFNRPGLLLSGGLVYVAFGGHCDGLGYGNYTGTIYVFNEALTLQGSFVADPGTATSIWMSGAGPAADASGNVFFAIANGTYQPSVNDYGDSIVKINANGTFLSAYTPQTVPPGLSSLCSGWTYPYCLAATDTDLGSGGVLLLPDQTGAHPHILVQAGKDGNINVVDRDSMTQVQQIFQAVGSPDTNATHGSGELFNGLWGIPSYWNDSIYFWGVGDYLKAFSISNGSMSSTPTSQSTITYSFPGANLSISANGSSSGIVWSIGTPTTSTQAVLQAYNATNVANLLYSSDQAPNQRDSLGTSAVRFSVPTVSNGRVYVAGQTVSNNQIQNQVTAYGLLLTGSPKAFLADVNGDHKADAVLFYPNGTWYVALSNGTSFGEYQQWDFGHGFGSANQFVADVNGDGKADAIVFDASGSWYVALSTGSSFLPYTQWDSGHGYDSANQFVADVNGDGKADAVVFDSSGSWYVALSTGTSFAPYSQWLTGNGVGSANQFVADANGDGKADVILFYSPGDWWVAPSTSSSFGPFAHWGTGLGLNAASLLVGDVNGDNKVDAAATYFSPADWYIELSSGSSFGSYTRWQ